MLGGPYVNDLLPVLCKQAIDGFSLISYPLSLRYLQFQFNGGTGGFELNETYRGEILLKKLLVSYPDHRVL